jgi:hypothetical protein
MEAQAPTASKDHFFPPILGASTVLNPQKFSEKETAINYRSLGKKAPTAPDFVKEKKTLSHVPWL